MLSCLGRVVDKKSSAAIGLTCEVQVQMTDTHIAMTKDEWTVAIPCMHWYIVVCLCERINSHGSLVVDEGNASLHSDNVNMVTTLKMNRELNLFLFGYTSQSSELQRQQRNLINSCNRCCRLQERMIEDLDMFPVAMAR